MSLLGIVMSTKDTNVCIVRGDFTLLGMSSLMSWTFPLVFDPKFLQAPTLSNPTIVPKFFTFSLNPKDWFLEPHAENKTGLPTPSYEEVSSDSSHQPQGPSTD